MNTVPENLSVHTMIDTLGVITATSEDIQINLQMYPSYKGGELRMVNIMNGMCFA